MCNKITVPHSLENADLKLNKNDYIFTLSFTAFNSFLKHRNLTSASQQVARGTYFCIAETYYVVQQGSPTTLS